MLFRSFDFWANYALRWKGATYAVPQSPDRVCVMDELSKKEMIAEGFREESLTVTGQPYLEYLFKAGAKEIYANSSTHSMRVLFLSQPFDIIQPKLGDKHPVEILEDVLNGHHQETREPVSLMIKLHPKEAMDARLAEIVSDLARKGLDVHLSDRFTSVAELIEDYDVVVGFTTIALFEARARGKRVLSLDLCECLPSLQNAMRQAGIAVVPCDSVELGRTIAHDCGVKELPVPLYSGATEKIVKEIQTMLEKVEANR